MEKIVKEHIAAFNDPEQRLGATYVPGRGTYIRLWAPHAQSVSIEWVGRERQPLKKEKSFYTGVFPDAKPGDRYWFYMDDAERIADPASRFQPEDTSGPSEVVDEAYSWNNQDWAGVPYEQWVIYEIHPGTYSDTHDFEGIIADLARLKDLGVTTLEIMPVSQFSGSRNWGYDGVFPHAVQHSYGGPEKLKKLVDAAHTHGLSILLDVVYNHIGPEGNVLFRCGPYATSKYNTPWGDALNFDGEYSDQVRRYFLQSAWQWLTEYHFDGLRLDAVQMIFDQSPVPFLKELSLLKTEAERMRGVPLTLIAETDMNDPALLTHMNIEAHWADDMHHCLHASLTGEQEGYYMDYGGITQLARIFERGLAYEGDYSPFRKRHHGASYEGINRKRLVVGTQNHDQIGNRLKGERLISLAGFEKAKLAAACALLSPMTPFLFMGEELACEQPFYYFISHHDHGLIEAVRNGRSAEWVSFNWQEQPPDPASPEIFEACVLKEKNPEPETRAAVMSLYYRELISLSKYLRTCCLSPEVIHSEEEGYITLYYKGDKDDILILFSFNNHEIEFKIPNGAEYVLSSARYIEDAQARSRGHNKIAPFSATIWKI